LIKLLSNAQLHENSPQRPWLDLFDISTTEFLRTNYEEYSKVPMYAKVDMYHYQMAAPLWEILPLYFLKSLSSENSGRGLWWNRTFEENLIPIVVLDQKSQRLQRATIS
jgi:hypothetical protein